MKRKIIALNRLFLHIAILIAVGISNAYACPNCKEGFAAGTAQASVGASYSITTLFMILVPIIVVSTLFLKIRHESKKARALKS